MLTDRFIRNAKPGMYADEGGLYLQVYASGTRAFLIRSQRGGRSTKKVLGHYPALSLFEARELLSRAATGESDITVRAAFEDYFNHVHRRFRKPEQLRRLFEKDILPTIESRPVGSLTRAELTAIFKIPVRRGAPTTGNAALTSTKTFLDYCEQMGWVDHNPIDKTKKETIGGPAVSKNRNLSWGEIESFLKWLGSKSHTITQGVRVGLYLCLLTGLRATEVLSLQDTGKSWMEGEAKRTRAGPMQYKVPCTTHVRAAMKLFHDKPAGHGSLSQVLARAGFTFTPHDLRRTFASRLGDLGVLPHIVEKLLNHKMVGMMAVYNRAEYWDERVAAMELWGCKLTELRRKSRGPKPPAT